MLRVLIFAAVSILLSASLLFSLHRFVENELHLESGPEVEVRLSQEMPRKLSEFESQREISRISWSADASHALFVTPNRPTESRAEKTGFKGASSRGFTLMHWQQGSSPEQVASFRQVDEIALAPHGDLGLILARKAGAAEGALLYFWTPGEGLILLRDEPFDEGYRLAFVGDRREAVLINSNDASRSLHLRFRRGAGANRVRGKPASLAYSFSLKPLILNSLLASAEGEVTLYPRGERRVAAIDLNNDGAEDLLTYQAAAGRSLWKGYTLDGVSSTLPGVSTVLGSSAVWSLGDERGVPVPGDYNGDGLIDFATYTPQYRDTDSDLRGNWQIYYSHSARMNGSRFLPAKKSSFRSVAWGHTNYRAVPADYDGDGKSDIAVFDPDSAHWHLLFASSGFNEALARFKPNSENSETLQWGLKGDIPFALDMNGDTCSDHVVLRPAEQLEWHIRYRDCRGKKASPATESITFGKRGDIPVPADFDGDGSIELAVYRQGQKRWLIRQSAQDVSIVKWSSAGRPFAQDFDADGRADLAFYHAEGEKHYEILSSRVSSAARRDLLHRGLGVQHIAWGSDRDVPCAILSLDHRMGLGHE